MGKDKTAKQVEVRMVNVFPKTVNQEVVESEGYCLTPRGPSSVLARAIKSSWVGVS